MIRLTVPAKIQTAELVDAIACAMLDEHGAIVFKQATVGEDKEGVAAIAMSFGWDVVLF